MRFSFDQTTIMLPPMDKFVSHSPSRELRQRIQATGRKALNQKNQPTLRPTIRWVNQKFEGVDVIRVVVGNEVRYVYQALGEFIHEVLDILGTPYVERYSHSFLRLMR